MKMREARIPVVLITGWKEDPMVQIFNEDATEEQVCLELSDEWHPEEEPFKTIAEFNAATDQFAFKLSYEYIKVYYGLVETGFDPGINLNEILGS